MEFIFLLIRSLVYNNNYNFFLATISNEIFLKHFMNHRDYEKSKEERKNINDNSTFNSNAHISKTKSFEVSVSAEIKKQKRIS